MLAHGGAARGDGVRVRESGRTVTSRALAVLAAFDERHTRLSLSDISRRSGLALTTAHRLVAELTEWQALERRDDGCYVIGRRLWHLGLLAPVQGELRQVALPFLQDLYDATKENVQLAVREGSHALYVERLSGRASVPIVSRTGVQLPLHATGVGKVLLAHAPEDLLEQVLADLAPVTAHTVTDPARLRRELAEVRRRGYATTAQEMTLGTCSVAAPVTSSDGEVVAAVGLVTTTVRRDLPRLAPAVLVTAAGVTRRLAQAPA